MVRAAHLKLPLLRFVNLAVLAANQPRKRLYDQAERDKADVMALQGRSGEDTKAGRAEKMKLVTEARAAHFAKKTEKEVNFLPMPTLAQRRGHACSICAVLLWWCTRCGPSALCAVELPVP